MEDQRGCEIRDAPTDEVGYRRHDTQVATLATQGEKPNEGRETNGVMEDKREKTAISVGGNKRCGKKAGGLKEDAEHRSRHAHKRGASSWRADRAYE